MSTTTTTIEGDLSTREILDGFDLSIQNDGITCQRVYVGPWPQIMRDVPRIGTAFSDFKIAPPFPYLPDILLYVDRQQFSRPAPETGKAVITASFRFPGGSESSTAAPPEQPQYTIQAGSMTMDLETHKLFNEESTFGIRITDEVDLDPDVHEDLKKLSTPLEKKWTGTLGAIIQMLKTAPLSDHAIILDALGSDEPRDLITFFFRKYAAGHRSFRVLTPRANITHVCRDMPIIDGKARIVTPPNFPNLPEGFEWLRSDFSGETTGRYGRWTANESFDGADHWDHEIYNA
jgi:hypothetical protein